jgi:hypothetical protein
MSNSSCKKLKLELNAGQYVVHNEDKWDILIGKIKIRGFSFPAQKKLHVFKKTDGRLLMSAGLFSASRKHGFIQAFL